MLIGRQTTICGHIYVFRIKPGVVIAEKDIATWRKIAWRLNDWIP
jgi:hypothetical protein